MRRFYTVYSHDQIGEAVFTQFENLPQISTGRKFFLSWSHYLKLMRIKQCGRASFYEIESAKNDWSLSELKRQYDSSLYEQLAPAQIRIKFTVWPWKGRRLKRRRTL